MLVSIDCDKMLVPNGFKIKPHRRKEVLTLDPMQIDLYLTAAQKSGQRTKTSEVLKELQNKPVLNACVFDHWDKNPDSIPEKVMEGRGTEIRYLFWDPIFSSSNDEEYILCVGWDGNTLRSETRWLGYDLGSNHMALLRTQAIPRNRPRSWYSRLINSGLVD